ncbi:hypothetical protein BST27_08360 [Mycobacterium intermedium]|uniref:Uncharacterized protein n=1 Tax=Mycobacterium intermedium TaxID=28445 RepID=A0A1E3SDQ2_MYCIE|nr:hypothetical protein [Mycobacterium intermedium]MCV6963971.1 hypothetical protein [Mycobacterium intermedium]ODR00215.1 hypothetical protein BHQ20_13925 [Mycobacterium intermedium]OPE51784.1 hypothetical protein BV508_05065 [Mycobacterium intermedium]ORB07851.1 hypothetical protein BST27_08360 [Mycobacterium intermedium]
MAQYDDYGSGFDDLPDTFGKRPRPNALGVVILVLMLAFGVGTAVSSCFKSREFESESRARAASDQRCKEIQPLFIRLVRWHGALLANPDEVKMLGQELSVDVEVKRDSVDGLGPYESVLVADPDRPGDNKQLFRLNGLSMGGYYDPWAQCKPAY